MSKIYIYFIRAVLHFDVEHKMLPVAVKKTGNVATQGRSFRTWYRRRQYETLVNFPTLHKQ